MPGDELLPAPDIVATRAITIAAAREQIWPWLMQIGPGRGGAPQAADARSTIGRRLGGPKLDPAPGRNREAGSLDPGTASRRSRMLSR
ncbi:hypothetical protein [Nocardia asiatica]|uniref:hypothetical protein n=1 Tax=Nocardia asiatica TaxID=209252 RepID=UPI00031A5229|nr:hypothetical protein [Nocardia asiatica]